jgi:hypothetical protein
MVDDDRAEYLRALILARCLEITDADLAMGNICRRIGDRRACLK